MHMAPRLHHGFESHSERVAMTTRRFKRGDHVSWNSEAGRVRGRIARVVTSEIQFKGYTVRASTDEPQYEIKSDTTDHIAMHKGSALRKLSR
jgi:hypothetical protein